MPLIPFPNIPALPGVPPLPRALAAPLAAVLTQLSADDFGFFGVSGHPRWGIFDSDGNEVILADSVVDFGHSKDFRIGDYPLEGGEFESYNKVETPYEERISFAKGGTDADRSAFLDAIDAAVASTDLYTVATPEITYIDANLVHYDYRRQSKNGVTLLIVDLRIQEVRVAATTAFTKTASPASSATQSGGTVQTQSPSPVQGAAAGAGAG